MNDLSGIVQWYGFRDGGRCGYCKGSKFGQPRCMIGATIHQVKCSFYDEIVREQWNRCGTYYYRPVNDQICCPQYTNRLSAFDFKITSQQSRVLKKVDHWLKTGERSLPKKKQNDQSSKKAQRKKMKKQLPKTSLYPEMDEIIRSSILTLLEKNVIPSTSSSNLQEFVSSLNISTQLNKATRLKKKAKIGASQICCNVVFELYGKLVQGDPEKKKSTNRFEIAKSISEEANKMVLSAESLEDTHKISPHPSGYLYITIPQDRFEEIQKPKDEPPKEVEEKKVEEEEEEEGEEKEEVEEQEEVVKDEIEEAIDTELVPATFTEEGYHLYRKYQINIHKDDPNDKKLNEQDYYSFLIKSSLVMESNENNKMNDPKPMIGYGTFHYRYRLRKSKKLIACSVLDVIPGGICSVYFFYDSDYNFLELGKYSVLHELSRFYDGEMKAKFPQFKYYYFGFYVHDCQKMRYKAQYKPQQVLCNVEWKWCDLDHAIKNVLKTKKFGKFYTEESKISEPEAEAEEEENEGEQQQQQPEGENNTLIYYNGELVRREIFPVLHGQLRPATKTKMDEFHRYMDKWSNHVAYNCTYKDIQPQIQHQQDPFGLGGIIGGGGGGGGGDQNVEQLLNMLMNNQEAVRRQQEILRQIQEQNKED